MPSAETTTILALSLFVAALLAFAALWLWRTLRIRRYIREARQKVAAWKAANPSSPPLTDEQFETFCAWYEAQALPVLRLDVGEGSPAGPDGSRLGGPAWLPDAEAWPLGKDGRPLHFLAQLDFAELPNIPDFPASGVLQFFIGNDDLYGADFDDLGAGNFKVIWRPALTGSGAAHPQARGTDEDCSPMSSELRRSGRRLIGVVDQHWSPVSNWTLERDQRDAMNSESSDRVWNYIEGRGDTMNERHHVGGYPDFTQDDPRRNSRWANRDCVLLQLWSYPDRELMWGDCGQANFMISRDDLMARDFSRVTYHWDCT